MKTTHATTVKAGAFAAALAVAGLGAHSASADEAFARETVKKMSDFLAAQQTLSFDMDTNLQVVTADGQKLDIASSASVAVARPDKVHAIRMGGFAATAATYDGKTFTAINLDSNTYGQFEFSGDLDALLTELRDTYGRPLPAGDLLSADVAGVLLADVTDVKDLGAGVIRGEVCDHFAFRNPEVDFQLWVAQGDVPRPCRFSVTSSTVAGSPSYTVEISNWGAGAAQPDFAFTAPEGATKVDLKDVPNLDDLSGIFEVKGAN